MFLERQILNSFQELHYASTDQWLKIAQKSPGTWEEIKAAAVVIPEK